MLFTSVELLSCAIDVLDVKDIREEDVVLVGHDEKKTLELRRKKGREESESCNFLFVSSPFISCDLDL
jgi:hypothetical protein